MNKHIFFIIRYSILSKQKGNWVIGRGRSLEKYREELFSKERLDMHEMLFFDITLPSIINNLSEGVSCLIITSNELPEPYITNLRAKTNENEAIKIVEMSVEDDFSLVVRKNILKKLESEGGDFCYITSRIDDDDALSDDFSKKLSYYLNPSFIGHAVSFSNGYFGVYEKNSFIDFYARNIPKTAQGLSYVDFYKREGCVDSIKTIYDIGDHTKVDEKVPLIINPLKGMYVRTIHDNSDMYKDEKRFQSASNFKGKVSVNKDIFERFPSFNSSGLISKNAFYSQGDCSLRVRTYHNTFVYYDFNKKIIVQGNANDYKINDDLYCVFLINNCLVVNYNGDYLSLYEREGYFFISSGCLSENYLKVDFLDKGRFSIKSLVSGCYLSALKDSFEITVVGHCKAWEIYELNS